MKKLTHIFSATAILGLVLGSSAAYAASASFGSSTGSSSIEATSTASTTAGILPDSPLYFLDVIGEDILNFFALGNTAKAERHLFLSTERLAEAQSLMLENKTDEAKATISKYEDELALATSYADKAKAEGKDTADLETKIADATGKHLSVLIQILNKAPDAAKAGIRTAMEKSQNGHDIAVRNASQRASTATTSIATSTTDNGNNGRGSATSTNAKLKVRGSATSTERTNGGPNIY